jgi:hypothetical protein
MWTKSGCDPTGSTLPILPFLSVSVSGSGNVSSLPAGITCGSTGSACSAEFAQNATVTLTSRPTGTPGKPNLWVFDHWEGACAANLGISCTVTMSASKSTRAFFVRDTF